MSGFRVTADVHHVAGNADGRDFFVVFNGWQNWRLTEDEARQLSADLLLKLAYARAVENRDRDRRAVPFAEWAAEQEDRLRESVF